MWLISPGIIFSRLPRWLSGKESAYQRRKGRRLCFDHGTGRSGVGNGNPLQYSSLDNSMDRGTCWAAVYRVTKSQTQLSDWANTHTVLSESICVVESGRISFFLWLSNILVYACTCMCVCACVCVCVLYGPICLPITFSLSTQSSVNGHFDWFYVLAITDNAAMNIGVHVSFWVSILGAWGTYGQK